MLLLFAHLITALPSVIRPTHMSPCANARRLSAYPWDMLAGHGPALICYFLALVHLPSTSTGHMIDEHITHHFATITFTLLLSTACAYHYCIILGQFQSCWSKSSCVTRDPREWPVLIRCGHCLVLLAFLMIAAFSVGQTITLRILMASSDICGLLTVDVVMCCVVTMNLAMRLFLGPTRLTKTKSEPELENVVNRQPKSFEAEVCQNCKKRAVNRVVLKCRDLLCCCCVANAARCAKSGVTRCPFCEAAITSMRRLQLVVDNEPLSPNDHCECETSDEDEQ